jgi:hypothetical protein
MSEEMRELVNEVIRYQLAKDIDITSEHIDQAPRGGCFDVGGYKVWAGYFASYTPWGVACIEQAFLERMRSPAPGESKRRIKRDIQCNPHLHPKIKERLLKILSRARVHFDWLKALDSHYCKRIISGETETGALEIEIARNTNLPNVVRENLLFNLHQRNASQ